MKIGRKVILFTVLVMLCFSLMTSAQAKKTVIHVQTFGFEGRDLIKLNVEIAGEDSDDYFIEVEPGILTRIQKEINIERLPITQVNETTFTIPKAYVTEIGVNEYVAMVPNDVARIKWTLKDKTKSMDKNDDVSILVMYRNGNPGLLKKYGTVTYEFLSGLGAAMDIKVSKIKALSEEDDVLFLEDDAEVHMCLSQSVPLINADDCWSAGYDGAGVKICILDTGIDGNHCDFPSGKIVAWKDYINSQTTPYDDHGHGTHCASIAAGATTPKGVAPGASLMGCKVLNSSGSGSESTIIAGIEWAVTNGADIISMSLGGAGGDGTSALAQKANWAVDQGVVVVCVVGGDGACCTVGTPGDAQKVITVTASDKSDGLASFNSRGPTTDGRI